MFNFTSVKEADKTVAVLGDYSVRFFANSRNASAPKIEQPKELPGYEQTKFESMLPTWQKGVDEGKTTPEDLATFLQSKYILSAEQIERINQMAPIEGEVQQ